MQITRHDYIDQIFEQDISSNAKLVCLVLLQYQNKKTGECYPSQPTLAKDCNMCRNTVNRSIQELENKGFISIEKKRTNGNKFTVNHYTFPFPCTSSEQSNEQSLERSNERSLQVHKPIEPIKDKYIVLFEDFYEIYPRKQARGKAEPAYKKAIKKGATHEEIIRGLKAYNEEIRKNGTERKYISLPSSWLNARMWEDRYDEVTKEKQKTKPNMQAKDLRNEFNF
jgi:DNA-binding transcriptional regulator YhcF (GntR family)